MLHETYDLDCQDSFHPNNYDAISKYIIQFAAMEKTDVGYRMFDRMPPGHGCEGRASVSNLQYLVLVATTMLIYPLGVLTRSSIVTSKVGSTVASEARLRFIPVAGLCAFGSVTNEHTEALETQF
jgi:hypothetical protein